jgi:hypothetical protein
VCALVRTRSEEWRVLTADNERIVLKYLLHPQDEAGRLAHRLLEYTNDECGSESRVLLLSATPYKMYTVSGEAGDDDHYRDFVETLEFLLSIDL